MFENGSKNGQLKLILLSYQRAIGRTQYNLLHCSIPAYFLPCSTMMTVSVLAVRVVISVVMGRGFLLGSCGVGLLRIRVRDVVVLNSAISPGPLQRNLLLEQSVEVEKVEE